MEATADSLTRLYQLINFMLCCLLCFMMAHGETVFILLLKFESNQFLRSEELFHHRSAVNKLNNVLCCRSYQRRATSREWKSKARRNFIVHEIVILFWWRLTVRCRRLSASCVCVCVCVCLCACALIYFLAVVIHRQMRIVCCLFHMSQCFLFLHPFRAIATRGRNCIDFLQLGMMSKAKAAIAANIKHRIHTAIRLLLSRDGRGERAKSIISHFEMCWHWASSQKKNFRKTLNNEGVVVVNQFPFFLFSRWNFPKWVDWLKSGGMLCARQLNEH